MDMGKGFRNRSRVIGIEVSAAGNDGSGGFAGGWFSQPFTGAN